MITPQTDIYLLKCPLQLSNKHQITFTNEEAQFEYFNSLPKTGVSDGSYQRKDGVIRYSAHIDNIMEYNYCMYRNNNYKNKWFYAFIVGMEYVNDNMTFVRLKTDVFQTWQFSLEWRQSYIEREMIEVSEDTPGANLIPETLETGEYKIQGQAEIDDLEAWYVVAYANDDFGYKLNGIYSGIQYYVFSDPDALRGFIVQLSLSDPPLTDKIVSIFTVPKLAFYPLANHAGKFDNDFMATKRPVSLVSTPAQLDGYTPRNNKLRTYPYLYVGFNPAGGSQKIYRYEDFSNGTPTFNLMSEINPNPQVVVVPQNYRGVNGENVADIGMIAGYPTISWSVDVFNVWLAQNQGIINVQEQKRDLDYVRNSIVTALGGNSNNGSPSIDLSGNAVSMVQNGINNLANWGKSIGDRDWERATLQYNYDYAIAMQNAQIEKQKLLPDEVHQGSNNATLIGYGLFDKNIFTRYTIKREFAERIDKFFDMYGYLTNKVKTPNLNNRPSWNYVKTLGANILASIPQIDLAEIKQMFDNGITLWHNPSTFLDYSQNNR